MAFAGSYGNGFLDRLEHRQQYKFTGQRVFRVGEHRLTLFGIGYYGASYIPGLVPIVPNPALPNLGDTIDPRQRDQTHTALLALNDVWQLTTSQQLQLSGFFRTYNLALFSNFGDGSSAERVSHRGRGKRELCEQDRGSAFLAGGAHDREAPRRDDLDHYLGTCPPTQQPPTGCGLFDPSNPLPPTVRLRR